MEVRSCIESIKRQLLKIQRNSLLISLVSLFWFLFRTGTKPSRATYPCQRAAVANSYLWLTTSVIPFFLAIPEKASKKGASKKIIIVTLAIVVIGSLASWYLYETWIDRSKPQDQLIGLTLEGREATSKKASDIFVVNGTTGEDNGVEELINLMGENGLLFYKSTMTGTNKGPSGLIASDDVVLIKVNSQWDERGGTNTDLLKTLIEAIVNHPDGFTGEIIVADNGQAQYGSAPGGGGSLSYQNNNAEDRSQSVQDVVDLHAPMSSYRVSTYLWDTITLTSVEEYSMGDEEDGYIINQTNNPTTRIKVSYPKFRTEFGTYISFKNGIWNPETQTYNSERLKIINVPVLKSHGGYGVTACVKHYMGVVSDQLTNHNAHQTVGSGGMGTEMVETRFPVLNILDAIWINPYPGAGPSTPYTMATRVNVIMASTDPVALDYWASKHVLIQAAQLKGHRQLSSIDPDNDAPGSFGNWLKLSMQELHRGGYQATVDEDQMNVYVVHPSSKG